MKTTKDTLSFDDWERYRSGKGNKELEKQISGHDLNYLAAQGFEKAGITGADVNAVIRGVNAKTFTLSNLGAVLVAGVVALVFITVFFFALKEDNKTSAETASMPPVAASELPGAQPEKKAEAVTAVLQPEAAKKSNPWKKEHFAIEKPSQPLSETQEAESNIEIEDMSTHRVNSVGHVNNEEINFEHIPNAPVIYMQGLKVTNFRLYYFKADKKFEIINGGFDPQFGGPDDYKTNKRDFKSESMKTTAVDVLDEALQNFSKQKYTYCINEMDLLLKLNPKDVNALFYSAMSMYFIQKNAKAIEYFDRILESENNIFHEEAEFYKALALAQNNQKPEAVALMKRIAGEKGFYAARAADFLKGSK